MKLDELEAYLDIELAKITAQNKLWEEEHETLFSLMADGKDAEKNADINLAVTKYTEAIEYGQTHETCYINNYLHCIDRLLVLYRKMKDYNKELTVCELAISNNAGTKYTERKSKILALISKSK